MSKKTLIIIGSCFLGFFIILILVIWGLTTFKSKTYTYEEVEQKIEKAVISYYKTNSNLVQQSGKYSFKYETLVNENYIKPLNQLLKNGDKCTASIIVEFVDGETIPTAYLNCGDDYQTIELYKKILNDNQIIATGSGLYQENNTYYFKGKIDNNYVQFGSVTEKKKEVGILWRIISINNNIVRLKAVDATSKKTAWDDRYNTKRSAYIGYNYFDSSILAETLKSYENDESILKEKEKAKLIATNLCIGARSYSDKTKDGTTECSVKSEQTFLFGTMTPYEYLRASTDPDCIDTSSRACSNYNYLATLDQTSEWLTTPFSENTYQAFSFDGFDFNETNTSTKRALYLTINLDSSVMYSKGDGTQENPYIVK